MKMFVLIAVGVLVAASSNSANAQNCYRGQYLAPVYAPTYQPVYVAPTYAQPRYPVLEGLAWNLPGIIDAIGRSSYYNRGFYPAYPARPYYRRW